jgi:Tfp pilus tip-associated adhesin PilY1
MRNLGLKISLFAGLVLLFLAPASFAQMTNYSAVPPFVSRGADPNVLFDLSIEWPTAGAAYNDQANDANGDGDTSDPGECGGRVDDGGNEVGVCYFKNKEYLGYFDSSKCYVYDTAQGRFEPSGGAINADHECSGQWSGNFLNWATMSAIDEFRWALTGGNRYVDTTTETVLERTNVDPAKFYLGHRVWQVKMVTSSNNVAPSTITPYSDSKIYVWNHGYQFDVGTSWGGSEKAANLYARVKVCDPSVGLEENCVDYGGYYKPEGLIQKNDNRMRFGVMGYVLESVREREGGVLRTNMKYVGPKLSDGSDNPKKEYNADGIFILDPENANGVDPEVNDSGVINYLNKFGVNGYKSKDPVSELYYECLNYYKNRGPTAEYIDGDLSTAGIQPMPASAKDGFPVITSWEDPIQSWCQRNYIVGINDAYPHVDKRLPGTYFTAESFGSGTINYGDYGEPSNADADINVRTLTNTVGALQGINGTTRCVGCTETNCDWNDTDKLIPALGEVAGPCPGAVRENSWYISGLAYYANTQDLRSDFTGSQTIATYMIDTQEYTSDPLEGEMNMLWLAGKYGGFVEKDFQDTNADGNDLEPNLLEEWDADSDGEPDNYIRASDPNKLVGGLNRAFADILKRASSGTAASVISNTRAGEGAVYQSIFYPYSNDANCNNAETNEVAWVGEVHALFVDSYGNMREDTNTNRTLDLSIDRIILFDEGDVYRFTDSDGDGSLEPGEFTDSNANGILDADERGSPVTATEINYIWSSNTWLNDAALITNGQRTSYDALEKRRYIFTFVDSDGDMGAKADGTEQIPFTTANKTLISPYLHFFTPFAYSSASPPPGINAGDFGTATYHDQQATRIINFIRGEDQGEFTFSNSRLPAMRSREIDFDCNGTAEIWRLGDVIHSVPTTVGRPAENYDLIYRDDSYRGFYAQYKNRRNMVYVGANDGMLHAFNAGFYDKSNKSFALKSPGCVAPNCETEFPLGAELWAFVPYNLLPHLYWLTDPNYSHVYYVDLKPRVFDAKIFPNDAKHPSGWGTVLVGGMRLGGGEIRTDKNHDGIYDPINDLEMKSAYFVLDITDPESEPKVLAEIAFDGLGYTTSYPTVVVMKSRSDPNAPNNWYLVLGSGPTSATGPDSSSLQDVGSTQQAKIYMVDLKELAQNRSLKDEEGIDLTSAGPPFQVLPDNNSFISDLVSVDLDLDYKTDIVYYGTLSGSLGSWGGKLRRIVINDDTDSTNWVGDSTLTDAGQPITAAPTLTLDRQGQIWIYFGTGRFMNRGDVNDTSVQTYYGIIEPWDDVNSNNIVEVGESLTWATVLTTDLADVSNAEVFEGGNRVEGLPLVDFDGDSDGTVTFPEVKNAVAAKGGWRLDFPTSGERNLGQASLVGDIVTFTTYVPNADPCEFEGYSYLYTLHFQTGTAFSESIIGLNNTNVDADGNSEVLKKTGLGKGLTITPSIHVGREKGSKAFIQSSTGAIQVIQQTNPGVTKSGKVSWQEE